MKEMKEMTQNDEIPCPDCYFKDAGVMVDPCFWCCQDECWGEPKPRWTSFLPDTMTNEEVEEHLRKEKEEMDEFMEKVLKGLKEIKNEQEKT